MDSKKRKNSEVADSKSAKKSRKWLSLKEKLDIIQMHEKGASFAKISKDKDINESSVRKIVKEKVKIREQGAHTADYDALKLTKSRSRSMLEMERLLYLWIQDCNHRRIPISLNETTFRAKE